MLPRGIDPYNRSYPRPPVKSRSPQEAIDTARTLAAQLISSRSFLPEPEIKPAEPTAIILPRPSIVYPPVMPREPYDSFEPARASSRRGPSQ